ncbi:MAG TPA: TetR/AcrR family transcriptional regulator [Ktedonobacteraceae bacterium]|jgi:AcrR family transcriptional regulator|nr:TetR/AcrR family transcriptional regulator [Ktedonobacteraceae bacterium]
MARTPKVVEDRREQIIDAALRVFAQKGYSKATNKDIAREAGITPGLIYYYFESKEALLNALIETRTPLQLLRSMPPEAFNLPPETFLRMLLRQVFAIVESESMVKLIRVMVPEFIHGTSITTIPFHAFERIFAFLGSYFEAKVATGELRPLDASLTVQTIVGCMIGFVLRRQLVRDPIALAYTQEQIVDSIVNTVLLGILPR